MRLYRITFAAGLAAGFVAGTRAGRERYDQMVKFAKTTKDSPAFQQAASTVQTQGSALLSSAGKKVADRAPKLASSAMHKVEDHIPVLRHRDGHGPAAANGKTGAGNGRPFVEASNSRSRPAGS